LRKIKAMSNIFKKLFGRPENLKSILGNGAIIVDVRTTEEFRSGHIEGALNVPLDRLKASLGDLKKHGKPVIVCCMSGTRSAMALNLLSQAGIEAYNGGGWDALKKIIR